MLLSVVPTVTKQHKIRGRHLTGRSIMLRLLTRLLPSHTYPVPKNLSKRREEIARYITQRHAEGNIRLTQGKVIDQASVDELYNRLGNVDYT